MVNAANDFRKSFEQTSLWSALAMNDILQRYRGSVLGPFWITLTAAAFVLGIGLVYSEIMRVPAEDYLPWIANGIVVWSLFAMAVQEGGDAYISQAGVIRQTAIPLPVFIWRVVLRNLINFAHQLVVVVGVALYFGYILKVNLPMAAVGLVLTLLNTSWIVLVVAIVSARYRDVQQAINSLLQVLFFLSPVIWFTEQTRGAQSILKLNPAYHILEALRSPLIGRPVPLESILYLVTLGVAGWVAAFLIYAGVRRRIVHYL